MNKGQADDAEEVDDWTAVAQWLAQVERSAAGQAEAQAALAVAAANTAEWDEALEHARHALLWEFASGRPLWKHMPLTWQALWSAIRDAAITAAKPTATALNRESPRTTRSR
jgi:hypothetical protein